ncbi:unnamed protein product [Cylindrotheca closterium]|uniref:Uncharacterized protein n=1 Tax=Cylindrotheca closterium TaxID=2856 RepID=A0AAD2GDP5_9STRA|nr:unnamed protein product [Cylindrotheca closterium]
MSLQQVIDLNNTAVCRMKNSHPEDAIEMLTHAVRCYKAMQSGQSSVPVPSICDQESVINTCLIQEQECWNDDMKIESNNQFVYYSACSIPDTLQLECVAPIVVFNLALARHFQGSQIQTDHRARRHILSTATRLYEIAFHTYLAAGGSRSGLMAIAITNNIALIYNEFGESALANKCFELLHSVLSQLLKSGDTAVMPYAYDFLRNLIPIQGPQVYAAGAA